MTSAPTASNIKPVNRHDRLIFVRNLSKVVWSEGMYLGPHHFQVQSSYFEDLIDFVSNSLWYEPCGFAGFRLDPEALANGTVSLVHARGVFPDGLPFHMPEFDELPEPASIGEAFSPVSQSLSVSLAVPARTPDGLNCATSAVKANHHVRYRAVEHMLHDDTTGRDERMVRLGHKNIRFHLGAEDPEGFVALPLARVVRDGSGHYVFDPAFVPPCLKITASDEIMSLTRRLIEILQEKSSTLSRTERAAGGFAAGFSAHDVASFWSLHAINAGLSAIRHLYLSKQGHPQELFIELSRLGGALCTFKLDSHPGNLPAYDHRNLEKCFRELDVHIRTHLEALIPTNCVAIPLKPLGNYFYAGEIVDQRCLDRARWILGVYAAVGEAELISRTPDVVKICSAQGIEKLVQRALPGLALRHLPVPPAAVSRKPEFHYFAVERIGPCWDHITMTRAVGVYVPGELPNPKIELSVILEA